MTITLAALALSLALVPANVPAHSCGHAEASSDSSHADHSCDAAHSSHAGHAAHAMQTVQSDRAGHAAHDAPAANPALPDGQGRWTPDAPLIENMARVRDDVATLAHHEMGHMDESDVVRLAADIDAAIASMFANCKLEPEPDVALHGLLARLMAGTQALHAKPGDASTIGDMRAAVQDYGRLFDDPGTHTEAGPGAGHR